MADLAVAVRLSADSTALANGLKPARVEIDRLKDSANAASGQLSGVASSTQSSFNALTSDLRKGKLDVSSFASAVAALNSPTTIAGAASRTAGVDFGFLVDQLKSARIDIDEFGAALQAVTGRVPNFGGVGGAAGEAFVRLTSKLQAAKISAAEFGQAFGALGQNAGGAVSQIAGLARTAAAAAPALSASGAGAALAGTGAAELAGSAGTAGVALSGLAVVAIGVTATVAAFAIGFGLAVAAADAFNAKVDGVAKVIARAGQSSQITAEQILSDNAAIAGSSGQAFDDVTAASLKLISSYDLTRDEINQLTSAGANMAATFGGDVTSSTDEVARAFDALGKGDAKALEKGFDFLSEATRGSIKQLIEMGETSKAQEGLIAALAATTHGGSGSASSAFGALTSATGTLIASWLASFSAIQAVQGWMRDLARTANETAAAIARAAYAKAEDNSATVQAGRARGKILQLDTEASGQTGYRKRATESRARTYRSQLGRFEDQERDEIASRANDQFGGKAGLDVLLSKGRQNAGISVIGRRKAPSAQGGGAPRGGGAEKLGAGIAAASRATRELDSSIQSLERSFDPVAAAAARYEETIDQIAKLQKAGRITEAKAEEYRHLAALENIEAEGKARAAALAKASPELAKVATTSLDLTYDEVFPKFKSGIADAFTKAGNAGGNALRDSGLDAAEAISQILGGKLGGIAERLIGLLKGGATGDFSGVGGRAGGALTLASQGKTSGDASIVDSFLKGIQGFGTSLKDVLRRLEKSFSDLFGKSGTFGKALGETLGTAFAGAQFGKAATDAVGVKGSRVGGALGALGGQAIGAVIGGPAGAAIGKVLGSVVGSVIGGLFQKTPTGTARITSVDGQAQTSGRLGSQLSGTASSVQSGINQIIEQLGGSAGSFGVSIGRRGDYFRVSGDANANVSAKHPGRVLYDGKSEAEATAVAILNAIQDGAVTGLSARVAQALQSSTDLGQAVSEALKVQSLEDLLAGFGGAARKTFIDFERQAKDRLRIAGKYGFDIVKLEAENGKARAKLLEGSIDQATSGLKSLIEQLTTGDKAAGTLEDRRAALLEKARVLTPLAATDSDAAAKLADILAQIEQVSLEANGTAGAQYVGDRNFVRSTAQSIIDQATAEITAAQNLARTTAGTDKSTTDALIAASNAMLTDIAGSLDDNYTQNAQMIALLRANGANGRGSDFNYVDNALSIGAGRV